MLGKLKADHKGEIALIANTELERANVDADEDAREANRHHIEAASVPLVARVEREGVVAQLADPDPQHSLTGLPGLRPLDVLLEEIDTQLGEETYCQVTFEVDCAKGIPSTLLEAFASITRNGAKNVDQGSAFVLRPS